MAPKVWLSPVRGGFTVVAPRGDKPFDVDIAMQALWRRTVVGTVQFEMHEGHPTWIIRLNRQADKPRQLLEQLLTDLAAKLERFDVVYCIGPARLRRDKWLNVVF